MSEPAAYPEWFTEAIDPQPRRVHFLSNYFVPPPPEPGPGPPRPEPTRVVCPACLRKIALLSDGRLARHGLTSLGCPGYDVWKWTEEGPPRPVTGEARAWLPFLRLMAAGEWEDRREIMLNGRAFADDSASHWRSADDALRVWEVAERNRRERGIPYDFCPEEREL